MRAASLDLRFDEVQVDIAFMQELHFYFDLIQIDATFQDVPKNKAWSLLNKAIAEQQSLTVERLFRLLGLLYDPKDMYHAYLGVMSTEKNTRAQALEFLDNVLEHQAKAHVLNLIDPDSRDHALRYGRDIFGNHLVSYEDSLRYLIEGHETWLQVCALNCVGKTESAHLRNLVDSYKMHAHPLVSETANLVLNRLRLQA